jgi:phosphoglycerol transferase MdoB-like AlkP superfamily enzyme
MTTNGITAAIQLNTRLLASKACSLLINRYTLFFLGVYALSLAVNLLGGMGGVVLMTEDNYFYFKKEYCELTLLFYLYCYCNMILRPSRWQAWLAAVPLLLAYLAQDIYYLMYSSVFRIVELTSLSELFTILTSEIIVLLTVIVAVPLGFFFWSINYRKWLVITTGIVPLLLLIGTAEFYPKFFTATFEKVGEEIIYWDDAISVANNGRFMMLLYREAERNLSIEKTEKFRDRPQYEQQAQQQAAWIRTNSTKRNVHLVVMESFIDPTLFQGARFTKDPVHPSFKKLFGNQMGLSVSPVVGGRTSQAEFELLCGVPAFEELVGVEFNSFTGTPAYCLPGRLELAGYRTMASNAYNPSFFNTPNAYKGIGFEKIFFPKEYVGGGNTYITTGDASREDDFMFDEEIFSQNIAFITPLLQETDGPPLFNYVLTIYGHVPHRLDETKRPQVLKMIASLKDAQLEQSANQFFYRSKAVADYVGNLLELDKKSLIIVVSDHVPPGQFGKTSYEKLRYLNNKTDSIHMNRILIIEGGKVKKYATLHHYDVPAVILNSITDGAYCRKNTCGFMANKLLDDRQERHDDYMRLMAHATE